MGRFEDGNDEGGRGGRSNAFTRRKSLRRFKWRTQFFPRLFFRGQE